MRFAERLTAAWYAPGLRALSALLWPAALAYAGVTAGRRALYRRGVFATQRMPVPVVVVGNLTAGGAGKTPVARALAAALAARGFRPGIVSRGYGGTNVAPRAVRVGDDPDEVGDEPLLFAADGHPVWIGHRRADAARALLAAHPDCDVVIADDGLQHYALGRDVEIAVVDAARGFGNGLPLPAGPLREPASRLAAVDAVVRIVGAAAAPAARGREFDAPLEPLPWRNLVRPDDRADPAAWSRGAIHALAGIGHPQRFFDALRALRIDALCHPLPDHHRFAAADLAYPDATAILMTEKDAVKCLRYADARCWYLPVAARLPVPLVDLIEEKLRGSQAA